MFTNFTRVINFALQDFSRNKGISIAAIFVLVITIMLLTGLLFFHGVANYLTSQLQNRIDITAYFKDTATEQDILNVKDQLLKMSSDIKNIEYVSKDQALVAFNEKHGNSSVLSKALQEVGKNPLLPSLNISTSNGDPSQYESISNILQTSDFAKFVDHVSFLERKDTINKIYSITSSINRFGLIAGVILLLVAILVVFNTIKLAIENSKQEIETMRIVGASDWFIRGPFMIQGIIFGVLAFVVCFLLSLLFSYLVSSQISAVLPGFDAFNYFLTNWWIFVLIQLGFGVVVGVISSYVVVKRYLDV
jgi:cell division transport system permease protein